MFFRWFPPLWPWFASSIELCWVVKKILHFLLSFQLEFRHFFKLNLWIFSKFCQFSLPNVMISPWFSQYCRWFASSIELCWIVKKILHFLLSFQLEFRHFFKLNLWVFSKFGQFSLSTVMFFRWFSQFWPWFTSSIELCWIVKKILHFLLSFELELMEFFPRKFSTFVNFYCQMPLLFAFSLRFQFFNRIKLISP